MFAMAVERDDVQISAAALEASTPGSSRHRQSRSQARHRHTLPPEQSDPLAGKITEIVLHSDLVSLQPMILPMLSQLSRGERWLALVCAPGELTREQLLQASADLGKTLTLRCDDASDSVALAAKALCAGTCHTVILWHPALSRQDLERLENAALAGGSHCLAIHGPSNYHSCMPLR